MEQARSSCSAPGSIHPALAGELRLAARTLLDGGEVAASEACLKRVFEMLDQTSVESSLQGGGAVRLYTQGSLTLTEPPPDGADSYDSALASNYKKKQVYHYLPLGCFKAIPDTASMLVYEGQLPAGSGPEACGKMCETTVPGERGYQFFSVTGGAQCYCGHKMPPKEDMVEEEEEHCPPCAGNGNYTCGGARTQSVYQACEMPKTAWVSEGEYISGSQVTHLPGLPAMVSSNQLLPYMDICAIPGLPAMAR